MRSVFRQLFSAVPALLALIVVVGIGTAGKAFAHGSGWSQESSFAVVVSLHYADQTPMLYCEVRIFSPADPKIPYQKGRSDRNGFFSFKPDSPGLWSFSASDAEGHQSAGEVEVTAEQLRMDSAPENAPPAKGGAPADGADPIKIALGLSVIANLGLFFSRKRKLK